MTSAPKASLIRRSVLGLIGAATVSPALANHGRVVTILGDSITAGFGLPAREALPARLELSLARLGTPAEVRAAGVSGDTTANGLARLDFSVQSDTDLCVVALGGNDLLQGLEARATRANLTAIVVRLKARHIGVLIAGLVAPGAIGAGYARDFNAVFPTVAKTQGVPLYPDLLAGVAGRKDLIQADGVHPNARGADLIAQRLAPFVVHNLGARA
jgi:acyl-CoA thioesterase-1